MANDHAWLKEEVGAAMEKLFFLRLPGGPYTDQELVEVCKVWLETILDHPVEWNQKLDQPRVNRAFRELLRRSDRWPTPKAFFDLLGYRPFSAVQEEKKQSDRNSQQAEQRKGGMQRLDQIIKQFGYVKE